MSDRIDAVVLAGGTRDDACAHVPDVPCKAFVPIGGVTLVARTIAALRRAPEIGRIVAVAPERALARDDLAAALAEADERRPSGDTMLASLRAGLAGFAPDAPVLVTASDLPILDVAAIADFLATARARDADLTYACVERRTHEARYPEVPHTWARLREGTFCGGGCVVMRPRVLPALGALLGRLGAARKNPVRLAGIFGPSVLVRYVARSLSIAAAERRASELVGAPVAAGICAYPQIAVNVDRASDVALAERLIAND